MTDSAIKKGREYLANYARQCGEHVFAGEVLAGCWDHRSDTRAAIEAALLGRPMPAFKHLG